MSRCQAPGWRVWRSAGLALLIALGAPAAVPGAAPESPQDDLIIELRVGRVARQTIVAAFDGDHVLIPARPLFELVEIRSSIDAEGCLRAVRQPQATELFIDGQLAFARVGTLALPKEQVLVRQTGGELYLGTDLIAGLLGVRVEVDLAELTVTLDPAEDLPVGRRVARERARAARHGGGTSAIADRVLAEDRDPLAGAVADWGVSVPDVATPQATSYALRLGARVFGGGLDLRNTGGIGAQQDFDASWIGTWPEHWGWRQLRLGSVLGTGPQPRPVKGIAISSSPFIRPLAFSESEVTGWLAPGWEVELYKNGELVDFGYADERGFYMLKTPIDYGENPIELRAYGPNGEMRELTRAMPVAADRLPPGECEYEATFGACDDGTCDQLANLDVRYGLNGRWTVRGGTETFARSGSDLIHPYAAVSGLLPRGFLVRGEGTASARALLGLGYEPNPDLRLYAEHERFAQGIREPILTPPGQRSRSRWLAFYRPDPRRGSTFLTAGGQQAMAEHGSDLRLNAGIASQVRNVRWSLEWREEHLGLGSGVGSTLIAGNASTAIRTVVPGLNGLFLRGTAELDCRRGGMER
ncbi:MAG TPA: hypothetical protein VNM87_08040, partial [Candidatus Udaeobacter sp.]|nr:hypothetical protein [Candidatus Udaeobacter sp.]